MIDALDPSLLAAGALFVRAQRGRPDRPTKPKPQQRSVKLAWRYIICFFATAIPMMLAALFYVWPENRPIDHKVAALWIAIPTFVSFLCVMTRDEFAYMRMKEAEKREKRKSSE